MTESATTTLTTTINTTPSAQITELFHYTFPTESYTQHRVRVIKVKDDVYFGFAKYFLPPNTADFIPSRKQYYFKIGQLKEFSKALDKLQSYLKQHGRGDAGVNSSSGSQREAGSSSSTVDHGNDGGNSSKGDQRPKLVELTKYTAAAALHAALAAGPKMPNHTPIPVPRFHINPPNMLRTTGKFPPIKSTPTIAVPCPTCPTTTSPSNVACAKRGRGRPPKASAAKKLCAAGASALTEKSSSSAKQKAPAEEGTSVTRRRAADPDDLNFEEFAAAPIAPLPIRAEHRSSSLADTVVIDDDNDDDDSE